MRVARGDGANVQGFNWGRDPPAKLGPPAAPQPRPDLSPKPRTGRAINPRPTEGKA